MRSLPGWGEGDAELREGTVIRLLTTFERTVPILAVRPASRRMSSKVPIFIEHTEKAFALCSQFNRDPANTVEDWASGLNCCVTNKIIGLERTSLLPFASRLGGS